MRQQLDITATRMWLLILAFAGSVCCQFLIEHPPAIHYTIERRGGPFAPDWTADLDFLLDQLRITESRFNFTRREVKGNKIVRVPKERAVGGGEIGKLIGQFGRNGTWYTNLKLGTPAQNLELDLDMLTKDFAITTTSSDLGSKFHTLFSKSYAENSLGIKPFPNCGFPSDTTRLPTLEADFKFSFAHCEPRKQSLETLLPSGSILGLAPSSSLSQLGKIPTFITQLIEAKLIKEEIISLTLINGHQGVLSVGGTIQEAIEKVEARIESFLAGSQNNEARQSPLKAKRDDVSGPVDAFVSSVEVQKDFEVSDELLSESLQDSGDPLSKRQDGRAEHVPTLEDMLEHNRFGRAKPKDDHIPDWKDGWKWSPVEGAAGWWQILMRGIWADQVKIMKNQPCIIDINTPFILAPPLAVKAFYASVAGSYRLRGRYSNFYAYPCNNPPLLHFEFGGWRFPIMKGTKSSHEHRGANGKFSLGKVSQNSGYCIGAVVETRMGVGDAAPVKKGAAHREKKYAPGMESGMLAGNGLRDVWVLGEPVFRGMGLVFDMTMKEVGFRTY